MAYHYTESGLPRVWLCNGYTVEKTPYGEAVAIHDVDGLHQVIGRSLAREPRLTGAALRFLRKELGLSRCALGKAVGASEQQVSRWERAGRMPKAADRHVRLLYLQRLDGSVHAQALLDEPDQLDCRKAGRMVLTEVNGQWQRTS